MKKIGLVLFVSIVLMPLEVSAQWTLSGSVAEWSVHRTSDQTYGSSRLQGSSSLSLATPTYASRMMSSGGAYSSRPTIDSNGKAVFTYYSKDADSNVDTRSAGPRKVIIIGEPDEDDKELPVGDCVLPFIFFVLMYVLTFRFRKNADIEKVSDSVSI